MAIPPFRGFHIGGSPLVILRLQVPVGLTEQTGEQRHKGDADERDTAACHQLLHALGLRAGIIDAVTFQMVDCSPDAKTCTKRNNKSLQYGDCAVEKMSVSQVICVIFIVVGIVGL